MPLQEVVAVLADREASGLEHARAAGIPTEVVALRDHPDRAAWTAPPPPSPPTTRSSWCSPDS